MAGLLAQVGEMQKLADELERNEKKRHFGANRVVFFGDRAYDMSLFLTQAGLRYLFISRTMFRHIEFSCVHTVKRPVVKCPCALRRHFGPPPDMSAKIDEHNARLAAFQEVFHIVTR